MLALTRKRNESIKIIVPPSTETQVIDLMVLRIQPTRVRLGFQAPREIRVERDNCKQGETDHDEHGSEAGADCGAAEHCDVS